MRLRFINAFALAGLFFLLSCSNDKPISLPSSNGRACEVLIVIDKQQWDGHVGDAIRNSFEAEQLGLPQPEPLFDLVSIPEEGFKDMFKKFRSIFIVNIKKGLNKVEIESKKDLWAQPQMVFKLSAPSDTAFISYFNMNSSLFISNFHAIERERIINAFGRVKNTNISQKIVDKYGIKLTLPEGYYMAKSEPDFFWLRKETDEVYHGILFHYYPYTDTNVFKCENIIALRDSLTKKYIPGPSDGSYMSVAQTIPPHCNRINFNGMFAVEIRGMWEVKSDFMGGAFVNYTLVDEKRNRVIALDGYVYAPRYEKRDYLLQVEAALYSLAFEDKNAQN